MESKPIRVLLADDDEDDFIIIRNLLAGSSLSRLELDWASSFRHAIERAVKVPYDVYLLDYLFETQNGIELMQALRDNGQRSPVIILTGKGTREVDITAMEAGADDYLEKTSLTAPMLERAIRYAVERRKTLEELRLSQKRLQALSEKLVSVQENERRLISRELHDSIGSSLTAIKFALETVFNDLCRGSAPQRRPLEQIIGMVRDTMEETRRISTRLRPALLDDLGILNTILWLCRKTQEVCAGTRIETRLDIDEKNVPEHLKIVICRITQEALNNAAKHSRAANIRVSLKRAKNRLELAIEDDGRGFDPEAACGSEKAGLGIVNMRERAELSGGVFGLRSEKGKGTRLEALWQLD